MAKLAAANKLLEEVGLPLVQIGTDGLPLVTYAAGLHQRLLGVGRTLHTYAIQIHPSSCPAGSMDGDGDGDGDDGDGKKGGEGSIGNNQETVPEATAEAQRERDSLASFKRRLATATKALDELSSLSFDGIRQDAGLFQSQIATSNAELTRLRDRQKAMSEEITQAEQRLRDLKAMPLGRPTQFSREVAPYEEGNGHAPAIPPASYDDLRRAGSVTRALPLPGQITLREAKALTKLVTIKLRDPFTGTEYESVRREWPEGLIPEGGRPPLSEPYMSIMSQSDIMLYNAAGRALCATIAELEEELDKR